MTKGPARRKSRGPSASAPTSGQRRCLEAAPGDCAAGSEGGTRVGAPAHRGVRPVSTQGVRWRTVPHREGRTTASATASTAPERIPPDGPGRPRSRPFSCVTGLLSPAVRSQPWSEVPRRTARSVRLIAPAEPRVVLSGPNLAGTDTDTNEACRTTVTRRTGERAGVRTSAGQMRPRHSSRRVMASAVPGLPMASL